jgi:hypothetical protein
MFTDPYSEYSPFNDPFLPNLVYKKYPFLKPKIQSSTDGKIASSDDWLDTYLFIKNIKEKTNG